MISAENLSLLVQKQISIDTSLFWKEKHFRFVYFYNGTFFWQVSQMHKKVFECYRDDYGNCIFEASLASHFNSSMKGDYGDYAPT